MPTNNAKRFETKYSTLFKNKKDSQEVQRLMKEESEWIRKFGEWATRPNIGDGTPPSTRPIGMKQR